MIMVFLSMVRRAAWCSGLRGEGSGECTSEGTVQVNVGRVGGEFGIPSDYCSDDEEVLSGGLRQPFGVVRGKPTHAHEVGAKVREGCHEVGVACRVIHCRIEPSNEVIVGALRGIVTVKQDGDGKKLLFERLEYLRGSEVCCEANRGDFESLTHDKDFPDVVE
jgi:hypothetical protein